MAEVINYYAIFLDGSNSPVHNLESLAAFPEYSFILKTTTIGNGSSFFESRKYEFVDSKGELCNLKMGEWELLYISMEKYHYSEPLFTLFNHQTKTPFDFIGRKWGIAFVKNELFPKLQELCNIKDYEKYLLNKRIENLEPRT